MAFIQILLVAFVLTVVQATPIILRGSSASGDTFIAISSSDPNVEKYLSVDFPSRSGISQETVRTPNPPEEVSENFSFAGPGAAAAGNGRSFVSTASLNPFLLPLFVPPINLEGFGLNNFDSFNDWVRGIEHFYEPRFGGGEVKTVTAVNDNGHVYGKVKTVTFDNNGKVVNSQ